MITFDIHIFFIIYHGNNDDHGTKKKRRNTKERLHGNGQNQISVPAHTVQIEE